MGGVFIPFLLKPGNAILTYVVFFFIGGGITGVCMIAWSMISDCIEIDEFKSGKRREGVYFGVMNFVQCSCSAFAIWVAGIVLSNVGYKPDINQTVAVQSWIKHINGTSTAVILVISIILCWCFPITMKKHKALREAIALKKAGKEYDTSIFENML